MRAPAALAAGLVALSLAACAAPTVATGGTGGAGPTTLAATTPATTTPAPPTTTTPGQSAADHASPDRHPMPPPDVRPAGFVAPPPGMGLDRYRGQRIDWGACAAADRAADGAQCATVAAPLDRADPDGQAITLALTRLAATREPRLGTIFVNPGGPGEGGRGLAWRFERAGLEQYDVVGWDPRGTGASTPVACGDGPAMDAFLAMDQTPDDAAEEAAYVEASRAFGRACLDRSGRLLAHVSTADSVADLDLLRGLVGDERLNFLGYSYGTDLGSRYAHTHPDRVGRIVLDSAVNPTDDRGVVQVMGFDRALTAFADWCAASGCGLGPDRASVLAAVTGLLDGLDAHPVPVGGRLLTQSLGLTGVILPLYGTQDSFPMLARAVADARQGRGQALLRLADAYNGRGADGSYATRSAAFLAISCLDEGDPGIAGEERWAREDAQKAPILGRFVGADLVCATWPVAPVPRPEPVRAPGAPPILVIGTTGDPATPYEYAQRMARQLESGVLVTRVGEGHGAYGKGNACIDRAVVQYFTGAPPPDGTRC